MPIKRLFERIRARFGGRQVTPKQYAELQRKAREKQAERDAMRPNQQMPEEKRFVDYTTKAIANGTMVEIGGPYRNAFEAMEIVNHGFLELCSERKATPSVKFAEMLNLFEGGTEESQGSRIWGQARTTFLEQMKNAIAKMQKKTADPNAVAEPITAGQILRAEHIILERIFAAVMTREAAQAEQAAAAKPAAAKQASARKGPEREKFFAIKISPDFIKACEGTKGKPEETFKWAVGKFEKSQDKIWALARRAFKTQRAKLTSEGDARITEERALFDGILANAINAIKIQRARKPA